MSRWLTGDLRGPLRNPHISGEGVRKRGPPALVDVAVTQPGGPSHLGRRGSTWRLRAQAEGRSLMSLTGSGHRGQVSSSLPGDHLARRVNAGALYCTPGTDVILETG